MKICLKQFGWLPLMLAIPITFYGVNPASKSDVLHLKNGSRVSCIIREINDEQISIEYPAPNGSGTLQRLVSWNELNHVEFGMHENLSNLLKHNSQSLSYDLFNHFEEQWSLNQRFLPYPQHPVGDLGIQYVKTILKSNDPKWLNKTLEIIDQISTRDWNQQRRFQAELLRLDILLILNHHTELRNVATRLLTTQDADPQHLAAVHLILARLDHKELLELEKENPRWEEDDLIRPQREDLFHSLIDHCLMPSLFYGVDATQAADGLALAQQVHLEYKDIEQAANYARDLVHLYPQSSHIEIAKKFLKQHQLSEVPPKDSEIPSKPIDSIEENDVIRRKRYESQEKTRQKMKSK